MDPKFLGTDQWADIGKLFPVLWTFLGCVIVLAFSMLIGHALIPSLVDSGHLPARVTKFRKVFYIGALIAVVLVAVMLTLANDFARVIADFWDRWWM